MADHKAHDADDGWQPATSAPGELYTPEGQIRSTRNFVRGLVDKDPRQKAYRRPMQRAAALTIAIVAVFVIVVVLLQALF
ncbi:MAG: hypothetical protein ACXWBO_16275 [Ilumatobacteraceae bacterium]